METISLFVVGNSWMTRHSASNIVDLFGTDTIPTPYTAQVAGHIVLKDITRLNPDRQVNIDCESCLTGCDGAACDI